MITKLLCEKYDLRCKVKMNCITRPIKSLLKTIRNRTDSVYLLTIFVLMLLIK